MSFPQKPDDLTVEFLTRALQADRGDIKSVSTKFVGDAIGNTSDVYFVHLETREGVDIPQSLVAKMIPQFEGAVEVDKVLRLFEREIEVYRNVAAHSPIRTPKLYWSDYDPETSLGCMLMEDCSFCESFDQTVPVPSSLAELEQIVECAAKLHARWWDSPVIPEGVLTVGNPTRTEFNNIVADGWKDLLSGGPGSDQLPESGREVSHRFANNFVTLMEERWPADNLTVMHLDFRLDNMFYDRQRQEPVIFDWQGASLGRGPYDLAYLISSGYAAEFRRAHESDLLQRYHETLVAGGVTGYSLADVLRDYRFGMVFSLWVVPFTAILDLSSERGQALVQKIIGGIYTGIEDHGADQLLAEMFPD